MTRCIPLPRIHWKCAGIGTLRFTLRGSGWVLSKSGSLLQRGGEKLKDWGERLACAEAPNDEPVI